MAEPTLARSLEGYSVEALCSRLDALEAARTKMDQQRDEATASIRRIARSLHHTCDRFNLPQVSHLARLVQTASQETLPEHLEHLISVLEDVVGDKSDRHVPILVVEPDVETADLLRVMLSGSNREVIVMETLEGALETVSEYTFELIVLALDLPDADGRNLLMQLRELRKTSVTPIFVLADSRDPAVRTECFALGADHVFSKPFDPPSLSTAVASRLQRQVSVHSKDPLTGLADRTALTDMFSDMLASRHGRSGPLCLSAVAVDHFSSLRDIYGHLRAENALRRTADLLEQSVRDADLLGRWNEDTFVVALPGTSLPEAAAVLDRSLQIIREDFGGGERQRLNLSCSAGITEVRAGTQSIYAPLRNARYFLNHARKQGGGRVSLEGHTTRADRDSILFAEDDTLTATILVDRLRREGFEVFHFEDGLAAYEAAVDLDPSLFLLDVKLPSMDGFELLARLRRMPSFAKKPILMLTAMSSEDDLSRGFELGADDYVLKPFSPTELVARIRRSFRRHRPS